MSTRSLTAPPPVPGIPAAILGLLLLLAGGLTAWGLASVLPPGLWWQVLVAPDPRDLGQMLFLYADLPRLAVALIAGAALGLSGALLQMVLRNPVASPTTLGVEAGANLALAAAMALAPSLMVWGREWVALTGGLGAVALVLAIGWRGGLQPVTVILGGLAVGLTCGAAAAVLILFNAHYLMGLFLWSSGSLTQTGWQDAAFLWPRIALLSGMAALCLRPLLLMALNDDAARGLGLSVGAMRVAVLGLAVALNALVVSRLGIIGFIGLAAPALAGACGARRPGARLLWSALFGAAILWLTDQGAQHLGRAIGAELPTGAVSALIGAPLLLLMLGWLRARNVAQPVAPRISRARRPGLMLAVLLVLILGAGLCALFVGPSETGWWASRAELGDLILWRAPRMIAAGAAGALLAAAGCLLQRVTGNAMASPEMLGIGAGATLGFAAMVFLGAATQGPQAFGAVIGAGAALGAVLVMAGRVGAAPERLLLTGLALAALCDALVAIILAGGDPRAMLILNWMSGSTYSLLWPEAGFALTATLLAALGLPLLARWLSIVPLGLQTSRALGLPPARSTAVLLAVAALMTAVGTLIVGPLTFVGLLAPHIARRLGLARPLPELAGAALVGALVMVLADLAGRCITYPWQIPAGLMATLMGAPVLIWILLRRPTT